MYVGYIFKDEWKYKNVLRKGFLVKNFSVIVYYLNNVVEHIIVFARVCGNSYYVLCLKVILCQEEISYSSFCQ